MTNDVTAFIMDPERQEVAVRKFLALLAAKPMPEVLRKEIEGFLRCCLSRS